MFVAFEHGQYSSRHIGPVVKGPDDADLRALYGEFVAAVEKAAGLMGTSYAHSCVGDYAKEVLGGKTAPEVIGGADEWHEADLFAAWLVHAKGWTAVGEQRVVIDGDEWRKAWSEDQ